MDAERIFSNCIEKQRIPDAFRTWEHYRNKVTDHILKNTTKGKSLAIFGAGRCNDIDLARLAGHFSEITLLDIDLAGMQEALAAYGLEQDSRIHLEQRDFVGIDRSAYLDYISGGLAAGESGQTKEEGIQRITEAMGRDLNRLYSQTQVNSIDLHPEKFDYTLSLGIHSQLNILPFVLWIEVLHQYGIEPEEEILCAYEEMVRKHTDSLVFKYNGNLLLQTREQAIIGMDWMNLFSQSYTEGCCEAITMLNDMCEKGILILCGQEELVWNFCMEARKAYRVCLLDYLVTEYMAGNEGE